MTPLVLLDFTAGAITLGLTALTATLALGQARTSASRYLAAFFACLAIESVASLVLMGWHEWLSESAARWLHAINMPVAYLLGPMLFGYARALTSISSHVRFSAIVLHALPFCIVLLLTLGNANTAFDTQPAGRWIFNVIYHGWVVQGVPYLIAAAWRTFAARGVLEDVSADEAALRLAWLRRLVAVIGATWVIAAIQRIPHDSGAAAWVWLGTGLDWSMAIALFVLAWFGLRQRGPLSANRTNSAARSSDTVTSGYARSGLDTAQCAEIASALTRLMTDERLYVDNQFDLQALSDRSGWQPNYISQALNQGLQRNFFEFVNGFRVADAKRCLADSTDDRTVLDIALACGFGSKSTFNTVFKRITGMTPSQFRQSGSGVPAPSVPPASRSN